MEKEKEWKESEEEDEEIAEEVHGSLERRKKKGSTGAVNGQKHSVFFEADEGVWKCRRCTWTYHLSGPGIDLIQNDKSDFQVAMNSHRLNKAGTHIHTSTKGAEYNKDKDFPRLGEKKEISVSENTIQNGNAPIEANDLITHNTVDAKEDNHHESGNLVPKSHHGSAVNNGNEIQECIELKTEAQNKLIIEEYDVEKIIGEQETHDLFCPNCHSCITKRVILRKRKRTGENKNDLPPEKVQHAPGVRPALVEVVDQEDNSTVFRCLSCLSFFIPIEGSFNIFRLFGKKDGSNNSRNSEKKPTPDEIQVPLLSGSKINDNKAEENSVMSSRDPSPHPTDYSSSMHTAGAMNLEAKENKNGICDTVMGDSYPSHGQMFDQDQRNELNYSATAMLPDRFTAGSYSNGVHMNNSAQQAKPTYESILSEAEKHASNGALMKNIEQEDRQNFPHAIGQNNMLGEPLFAEENSVLSRRDPSSHVKDNSSFVQPVEAMNLEAKENRNEIHVMGDPYPSHGQMFDQDRKNEPNYSATTMLPESYSNGIQINNSASQAKPTYASIVSKDTSAEKQTSNGALMVKMGQEDKHSFPHTIGQDSMLDTSIRIPDPTGGVEGDEIHVDKTLYLVQVISEEEDNVMFSRDPSFHLKDNSSSVQPVEAMNLGAKENKNGINDTAMGDPYPSHGQMFDQDRKNEPNYSATTMLPESYSNDIQMNNSAPQAKPTYALIVSNDKSIGIPDPRGDETQGGRARYPEQAVSEGTSNGTVIGTPGGSPSNLASSVSDGVYTSNTNLDGSSVAVIGYISSGNDVNKPVSTMQSATPIRATTENNQISYGSDAVNATSTVIDMGTHGMVSSSRAYEWDILKSIVYGGLIESIMSLSLVASAAGAGSSTINICALGLANLVGGLFLLAHDLSELRIRHDGEISNQIGRQPSQYWEKLGKREHAKRHICISFLSFIIFGALPPIVYAFTFRQSSHKEHKIIAMAVSSLVCIAFLAAGKAHIKSQNGHLKLVFYYLGIALPASGLSYVAGVMIHRVFVALSLFDPATNPPLLELLSSY